MRVHRSLLSLALVLSACQVSPAGAPKASSEPGARKAVTRAPSAAPSVSLAASPPVALARAGGLLLKKPADTSGALHGLVRLDASYLVNSGAGRLIGADGASLVGNGNTLIGADGASLVGADGGTLIGADGASLVGADGGSLIGADGASLIGADGGSAVAISGSTLVAAGAGNAIAPAGLSPDGASLLGSGGNALIGLDAASLVGMGGNGLVNSGAGAYRLAQAPAQASSALAAGATLPAAGMLVAALSLADGKPLPVGEDGDGKPVYAVYTDAAGRYEIFPPASARGNLRVVALAGAGTDPRLRYGVFARSGVAESQDVSEPAALAAAYIYLCVLPQIDGLMRKNFKTRLETMMEQAEAMGIVAPEITGSRRLEAAAAEVGYETWPDAERQLLQRRIVDIAISGVDFNTLTTLDGRPALPVIEGQLAANADAVARMMANPPAGLTAQTMFDDVPTLNGYKLLRPSDYNEFVVTKIIAIDPLDTPRIVERVDTLRLEMNIPTVNGASDEIGTASYGIAQQMGSKIFAPDPVTGELTLVVAMEAAIRNFKRSTP